MDAVLDTQLFLYAFLNVAPFRRSAFETLDACEAIWAPDSLRAEVANATWQWIRSRNLPTAEGRDVLIETDALVDHFVPADELWLRALDLAVQHEHPVYDTLFVALAEQQGLPLVTFDRSLLKRFSSVACTAEAFLARR